MKHISFLLITSFKAETLLLERTYDDPSITDVDSCLYDICMSVDKECTLENTCIIQGGKFAVYHFKGFANEIYGAYQNMYMIMDLCIPINLHFYFTYILGNAGSVVGSACDRGSYNPIK